MIYDTFMFNNELPMLECRLRELEGLVDRHVLVESPVTHRGEPKPLYYTEYKDRFARWHDRIEHVVCGNPDFTQPWDREHYQRDCATWGMLGVRADDIVLISDVDEFPPRALAQCLGYHSTEPALSFRQRLCMYAVDWEYPERHVCTVAARWGYLAARWGSLGLARDSRHAFPTVDGGWHLTWLGGVAGQRAKLEVTCHRGPQPGGQGEMTKQDMDRIWSGRCYRDGLHHAGSLKMIPVEVDESWPAWIAQRKCPPSWFRPR